MRRPSSTAPLSRCAGVLNPLGGVAFAYSFSLILMEIQDTLKQPPSAPRTMLKAVNVAVTGTPPWWRSRGVDMQGVCARQHAQGPRPLPPHLASTPASCVVAIP